MRILMLNYEFPPLGGGAANANYYMLKEFAKIKDIEIDLVTSSKDSYSFEQFSKNINIYKLDVGKKSLHYWTFYEMLKWSIQAYFKASKLIKNQKYDVCHCWFGWPAGVIGWMFRKKVPYIVGLRGSDVPGYNSRLRILDKLIFSQISKLVWAGAKRVIANSDGLRKLALKTNPDCKMDIIYNGIDTSEFKQSVNKEKSDVLRLISIGRLIERKGYNYLIKALQGLDGVKLTLVGEGNLKENLKKLAASLNVNLEFAGYVEHSKLVKYYHEADIFVLPSLNEGMSNTVLEAMACGLPLIVTDVGGTSELIKENGFVVSKRNSLAIKDVVSKFLENRRLLSTMGRISRYLAQEMSWKEVVKEYTKQYEG